ncbi:MAG: DnaJ domain-containing protein [Magnetococcales bacterium]|nr:DnaJ domain-containing protein [Magnetococcales bacterium]
MIPPSGHIRERLLAQLTTLLSRHPEGIKEYELYQQLKKAGIQPFCEGSLTDPLVLFRCHFLLFHLLYTLQDHLRSSQGKDLDIHCLNIQIKPWNPHHNDTLEKVDPLRSYYLDSEQLEQTERQDVEKMMADFWTAFTHWEGGDEALVVLGLEKPVSREKIKKTYRKLAKTHHPDRGGDPTEFRRITAAAKTLLD